MKCGRFARLLADFQEGNLPASDRAAAAEHLENCPGCRKLLAIARGGINILPENERDTFTRTVLDRTSGSVCPRVESILWDFAGGWLDADESKLIVLHLEHCVGCRSLAASLSELQEVLPSITEIDPGVTFTEGVIARTSGQRRSHPDPQTRIHAWWNQMVRRPLFSLEAAYVATLVLFFAFSPFLPFRDIALNKFPSAAIRPSAKFVVSSWENAKIPASSKMKEFSALLRWSNQTVSESLSSLAKKNELSASSVWNRSLDSVQGWRRESAANLLAFWMRVSGWRHPE